MLNYFVVWMLRDFYCKDKSVNDVQIVYYRQNGLRKKAHAT